MRVDSGNRRVTLSQIALKTCCEAGEAMQRQLRRRRSMPWSAPAPRGSLRRSRRPQGSRSWLCPADAKYGVALTHRDCPQRRGCIRGEANRPGGARSRMPAGMAATPPCSARPGLLRSPRAASRKAGGRAGTPDAKRCCRPRLQQEAFKRVNTVDRHIHACRVLNITRVTCFVDPLIAADRQQHCQTPSVRAAQAHPGDAYCQTDNTRTFRTRVTYL